MLTLAQELSYFVRMLEDLKLDKAYDGFLFLAESTRHPPKLKSHRHIELELNLVVRGTITYVVSGRRFTFQPRSLLWLFPEQEHQLVDRSDNAQNYVAVFKPSLIARSCRTGAYEDLKRKNHDKDGVLNTLLEPDSFDLIRKTMDSLMQGSLNPDLLNREAGFGVRSNFAFHHADPDGLNAGLHHLLLLCWRSRRTGRVLGDAVALHPVVRCALKLLSEGDGTQNLAQLAKSCGASEAYLSRTFRRQIGVPLTRYRNSLRLSRFLEQYRRREQKTLTEAVYAAGFGSYAQFYKVFRQAYGRGPRASLASGLPAES
ncbi:MAG: cupin domain-containing protein [Acidobacteriaceae bacterium]